MKGRKLVVDDGIAINNMKKKCSLCKEYHKPFDSKEFIKAAEALQPKCIACKEKLESKPMDCCQVVANTIWLDYCPNKTCPRYGLVTTISL